MEQEVRHLELRLAAPSDRRSLRFETRPACAQELSARGEHRAMLRAVTCHWLLSPSVPTGSTVTDVTRVFLRISRVWLAQATRLCQTRPLCSFSGAISGPGTAVVPIPLGPQVPLPPAAADGDAGGLAAAGPALLSREGPGPRALLPSGRPIWSRSEVRQRLLEISVKQPLPPEG